MAKRFIKTILRRPVTVVLLIFAVVVFGLSSLTGMPLEYLPDMEMPMQLVMITWPGADADSIDRLVTQPVEDECETITGIDSVGSYTYDNYAMIQLTYNYGTDLDEAHTDLKNAMDVLMPDLPDDCNDPVIMELGADFIGTMIVSAVAPEGVDITNYLDDTVVPRLEAIDGVAKVDLTGAEEEYLRIVLDEAAMRQYGLAITTIASAIATADFDMPAGDVTLGTQDISLGVYGSVQAGRDLTDLPIQTPYGKTIRLGDVCTFCDLYSEESDSISRFNGDESVMLQITKQDSASTVSVCEDVDAVLEAASVDGIGFQTIYSEADSIIETLSQVLQTLAISVVLTMLVLLVFFGDWRASIVVALSIPLSILLAVILLNWSGFAIDLMTGTSLIIAIGMIVDNSIVIIESCMRYRQEGLAPREAAAKGTATMLMSVAAGTLTTVVVYIPLALAQGMTGMMSGPLSWTILLTMLSSLLCAVVVVPLAFLALKPKQKDKIPANRLLERMRRGYRRLMPKILRRPGWIVLIGVACFAGSIVLLSQMEFVLMPDNYDGSLTLTATFRSGTKASVIDEQVRPIEEALLADANFDRVTLSISDNAASFTAYAVDNCQRSSENAVEVYLAQFGALPGVDVAASPASGGSQMSSQMSTGNSKEVTLSADDMDGLREGAEMVEDVVRKIPGVLRVENEFSAERVKGKLVVDSQKAQAAGTSEMQVAGQIRYLLSGNTATDLEIDGTDYDVILEYPDGKYDDITSLLDYPIATASGRQIAVRDIATLEYENILPLIRREDGHYVASVTATTESAAKYEIANAIDQAVSELAFPQGVGRSTSMLDDLSTDEMEHSLNAIATAIFLVFLVMAIQFNSPRLSIMVMLCIPLSLIGSVGMVFAFGRPLSMMGLMGFLMLVGIAVNNGIYLIDGTTQLRETMPLGEALVEAGTTRLRPILMTTLTTIISMVPMIFSTDSGMGMMKDMAYIIIGGLIASTILAMFLMPAFYLLIRRERLDGTRKGRKGRKEAAKKAAEQAALESAFAVVDAEDET